MKRKILTLGLAIFATLSFAQNSDTTKCKNWDLSIGTDIASRYLWRGQEFSNSPCFQPLVTLSYKNLSLASWSSYTFSKESLQEFDLYLTYKIKNVSISVNDYYAPDETVSNNKYFIFENKNTAHLVEAFVNWTGEKIPLSISAGTYVFGADYDSIGNNTYSTYAELAYNTTIKDNDVSVFLGFTPKAGYYGETMGVVNCGFTAGKEIEITDKFSVPMKATIMFNPQTQNCWVGLTLTL